MAYVAVSSNTVELVRSKIHQMAQAELGSLTVPKLEIDEQDCAAIEQKIWGDDYPLMATLPAKWLRAARSADVSFRRMADTSDPQNPVYGFVESIEAVAPRAIRIPPKRTDEGNEGFKYSDSYRSTNVTIDASLLSAEKTAPLVAAYEMRSEATTRWRNVKTQVVQFLEGAKSLNEALKLWPQLEIYVPAQLMHKVLEKKSSGAKTESRAAEILKSMDTEAAVASAALARMAQSQAETA